MASSSSSPEISAAAASHSPDNSAHRYSTIDEVLEDLSSRFILNLPDEELASLERVCFQVEQAHWFYEDFVREENPKFPSLPLKKFSALLFQACPLLRQWTDDHEQTFTNFMQYKTRVPVCGAIMLNETWEKCILVKGWKSSSGWGFPKGKINQDEEPHKCAVREVLEETGYDLSGKINPAHVIEVSIREQKISLYIVPDIPEDYPFKTRTRKEISRIEWFKLTDLPTWRRNKAVPGKFYLISPFIGPLRTFIGQRRSRNPARRTAKPPPIRAPPGVEAGVDLTLDLHSHINISHNHSAQESSSSSSADNGAPDTPSPQWSEPQATQVVVESDVPPSSLDPDLARLLNALSLSAGQSVGIDPKEQEAPSTVLKASVEAVNSTPVPADASFTDSISSLIDGDRPGSVRKTQDRPPSPHSGIQTSVSSDSSAHLLGLLNGQPSTHPIQIPLNSPVQPIEGLDGAISAPSQVPSSALPLSSPTSVTYQVSPKSAVSSSRPAATRRGSSSNADISPYLLRPSEIPSSGKRLKQLALLETVADESARMTPVLMQRNLATPGTIMSGRMSTAPSSPMSVQSQARPSHPAYSGVREPRVLYSSVSNPQVASFTAIAPASLQQSLPPFNQMAPSDPYKVRAQTSMSFHPNAPTHGYRANGRSSMHERQLLATLNGPINGTSGVMAHPMPHAGPLRPAYGPYPSTTATPYSQFPQPSPLQDTFSQARVNRVLPSMQPPHMLPGPSSTTLPPFNTLGLAAPRSSTPHDNAQLLSILNSHGPIPVESSVAAVPSPSVLNTIGSR